MNFSLALEMLGIAFTGCDPIATGICGDKALTKRILTAAGIRTPRGFAVTTASDVPELEGTWIVKPSREDAGIGIEAAAVCSGRERVAERVAYVVQNYRQPALVEQFVDGRELNQALYEGRKGVVVLPPGEILFADELPAEARLVGWKAKWAPGSAEDRATVNRTPGVMTDTMRSDVADICTRAASVLSLGGYCRFDLRQDTAGELWIIDINPNPDIGADTGFRKALAAAGIEFAEFLNELMISAQSRRNR
jgi:D-alanine-D-alanine ligase